MYCSFVHALISAWERNFPTTKLENLQIGMTTASQVAEMFGPPEAGREKSSAMHTRIHFGDEDAKQVWRYFYASGNSSHLQVRSLQVEFDANSILTDYIFRSSQKPDVTKIGSKRLNLDLLLVRNKIQPGRNNGLEVTSLLGSNYIVLPYYKPGIAERRYYVYSEVPNGNRSTRQQVVDGTHRKSLIVDLDSQGLVQHMRGESDFPEDVGQGPSPSNQ